MSEQATKTIQLQAQFICPIWAVWFGQSVRVYVAKWHATQMMDALRANKTQCAGFDGQGNLIDR